MFTFCHNNYIQYGWGNQLYGVRTNSSDKLWMKYGSCKREPEDYRQECINAAKNIYESTEKKILIHLSGGIDSEVVCRSFLEAGINFEVCVWVYENKYNRYDLKHAYEFCNEYNIKVHELKIDIIKFAEKDMFEIFTGYSFSPLWWSNLVKFAISKMSGYQIIGDFHFILIHDPLSASSIPASPIPTKNFIDPPNLEKKTYNVVLEAQWPAILSYTDQIGKTGTGFFSYSPELLLSFANDSLVQDWLKNCKEGNNRGKIYPGICHRTREVKYLSLKEFSHQSNSAVNIRPHIMYKHWSEMKKRKKSAGIESIKYSFYKQAMDFAKKYPYNSPGNEVVTFPAEEFISNLKWGIK